MIPKIRYVPLRLGIVLGLIIASALINVTFGESGSGIWSSQAQAATAPAPILVATNGIVAHGIDPMSTGSAVSRQQLSDWEAAHKRFLECGLCGKAQEFPGDIGK